MIFKIWVKLIFLMFYITISTLFAQDICLSTADKYFKVGNYDLAITEYKRFLFFNQNTDLTDAIFFKIGIAYRNQGMFFEAINAIEESISKTYQDSIKDDRKISKAIINIAKSDYSTAEFDLIRIATFSKYEKLRTKAYFFLGICYLYTSKWNDSHIAFNRCFANFPVVQFKIDSLFDSSANIKFRSPNLAKWLSTFLPGSGQIYGSDVKNGINALAINLVTSYFLVNSIIENNVMDVCITNIPLFERYYRGNRYNAEQIVINFNKQLNKKFEYSILQLLNQIDFSAL